MFNTEFLDIKINMFIGKGNISYHRKGKIKSRSLHSLITSLADKNNHERRIGCVEVKPYIIKKLK